MVADDGSTGKLAYCSVMHHHPGEGTSDLQVCLQSGAGMPPALIFDLVSNLAVELCDL